LKGGGVGSNVELGCDGFEAADISGVHFFVLVQKFLLVGCVQLDELIELKLAKPESVIQANRMEH